MNHPAGVVAQPEHEDVAEGNEGINYTDWLLLHLRKVDVLGVSITQQYLLGTPNRKEHEEAVALLTKLWLALFSKVQNHPELSHMFMEGVPVVSDVTKMKQPEYANKLWLFMEVVHVALAVLNISSIERDSFKTHLLEFVQEMESAMEKVNAEFMSGREGVNMYAYLGAVVRQGWTQLFPHVRNHKVLAPMCMKRKRVWADPTVLMQPRYVRLMPYYVLNVHMGYDYLGVTSVE